MEEEIIQKNGIYYLKSEFEDNGEYDFLIQRSLAKKFRKKLSRFWNRLKNIFRKILNKEMSLMEWEELEYPYLRNCHKFKNYCGKDSKWNL